MLRLGISTTQSHIEGFVQAGGKLKQVTLRRQWTLMRYIQVREGAVHVQARLLTCEAKLPTQQIETNSWNERLLPAGVMPNNLRTGTRWMGEERNSDRQTSRPGMGSTWWWEEVTIRMENMAPPDHLT